MEAKHSMMTIHQAKECAMCTIDKLYCDNEHHTLSDTAVDKLRDCVQILMYCKELEKTCADK